MPTLQVGRIFYELGRVGAGEVEIDMGMDRWAVSELKTPKPTSVKV